MTTTTVTDWKELASASGRGLGFGDAMRESLDPQPQNLIDERSAD